MSREVSPATGKTYGLKRVCAALNVSRSTVYARQKAAASPRPAPVRRGPKPSVSDEAMDRNGLVEGGDDAYPVCTGNTQLVAK